MPRAPIGLGRSSLAYRPVQQQLRSVSGPLWRPRTLWPRWRARHAVTRQPWRPRAFRAIALRPILAGYPATSRPAVWSIARHAAAPQSPGTLQATGYLPSAPGEVTAPGPYRGPAPGPRLREAPPRGAHATLAVSRPDAGRPGPPPAPLRAVSREGPPPAQPAGPPRAEQKPAAPEAPGTRPQAGPSAQVQPGERAPAARARAAGPIQGGVRATQRSLVPRRPLVPLPGPLALHRPLVTARQEPQPRQASPARRPAGLVSPQPAGPPLAQRQAPRSGEGPSQATPLTIPLPAPQTRGPVDAAADASRRWRRTVRHTSTTEGEPLTATAPPWRAPGARPEIAGETRLARPGQEPASWTPAALRRPPALASPPVARAPGAVPARPRPSLVLSGQLPTARASGSPLGLNRRARPLRPLGRAQPSGAIALAPLGRTGPATRAMAPAPLRRAQLSTRAMPAPAMSARPELISRAYTPSGAVAGGDEAGFPGISDGLLAPPSLVVSGTSPQIAGWRAAAERSAGVHAAARRSMPTSGPRLPLAGAISGPSRAAAPATPAPGPPERGWPAIMQSGGDRAIQRAPDGGAPAPTAPTSAAPAGVGPAEAGPEESAAGVDLDALARQVYDILVRRLRVEQERARGRSG
jgi:hypothetical protein